MWGEVWSYLPPPLGPALLPQSLQGRFPCENSEGPCAHEKVVWTCRILIRREIGRFDGSRPSYIPTHRDWGSPRELYEDDWRTLSLISTVGFAIFTIPLGHRAAGSSSLERFCLLRCMRTARLFGDHIVEASRAFADSTSISAGIDFAMTQLERAPYETRRRVIGVSGDGDNNSGRCHCGAGRGHRQRRHDQRARHPNRGSTLPESPPHQPSGVGLQTTTATTSSAALARSSWPRKTPTRLGTSSSKS